MDFAETIAILVVRELPGGMTNRTMGVTPLGQAGVDVILIRVHDSTRCNRGPNQWGDRHLLHVLQHPDHYRPVR